jgi:type VI secretion system protein ImpA
MDARVNGVLAPISDEHPCGEDLSFSPEFDRIMEARREDDPTVDYGEWQVALKQADWPTVVACCTDLLQTRSKDLRLAAWLAEADVKTTGLAGLRNGIEMMSRLIQRFGSDVHPRGEDGDHERRIGTVSWFVTRMAQVARQIPLTQSKAGCYCLSDHESAVLLQSQAQRNAESTAAGEDKVTVEKFATAVAKTDKRLYLQWIGEATECRSAAAGLLRASDDLFGIDGPSLSPLEQAIDALHLRLSMITKELGIGTEHAAGALQVSDQPIPDGTVAETSLVPAGPIKTRAHALELLRQVAIFFRATEPHSPVAYLADKAAYWGNMPLHSWLRSVVKDHGTLAHIEELLGLELESEQGRRDD